MQDRFFFSLSAVVAATFVVIALQPWAERPPSGPVSGGGRNAEDITIAGEELHRFVPGDFDAIAILTPPEGGDPVLRITLMDDETFDAPRSGPHVVLDSDVEYAFESRPVRVEMVARASGDFGARQFEANYYARPEGESGWKPFDLTPEWRTYTFDYEVPKIMDGAGYDYIGIRPVAPEKRSVMELRSLRIHATGPKKID
jgi:hypothetical protein